MKTYDIWLFNDICDIEVGKDYENFDEVQKIYDLLKQKKYTDKFLTDRGFILHNQELNITVEDEEGNVIYEEKVEEGE